MPHAVSRKSEPVYDDSDAATRKLFHAPTPAIHRRVHEFRLEFEKLYGRTDLSIPWSSSLSTIAQNALYRRDPNQYYMLCPPFLIAYYEMVCAEALREGNFEDCGHRLVQVIVKNKGRLPRSLFNSAA